MKTILALAFGWILYSNWKNNHVPMNNQEHRSALQSSNGNPAAMPPSDDSGMSQG